MIDLHDEFDVLFVDEAWQLAWADFMLLSQVAGRFVLIGDPGQIPPVVTIDTGHKRGISDLWQMLGISKPPVDLGWMEKLAAAGSGHK